MMLWFALLGIILNTIAVWFVWRGGYRAGVADERKKCDCQEEIERLSFSQSELDTLATRFPAPQAWYDEEW